MASLLLGVFDLLDPASPVRLVDWDRGGAVPTVSEVQASILDGARVYGEASGNRQVTLQVLVQGDTRLEMAQNANQLLAQVNQPTWTLTFTPDGGFPTVFDCYRGGAVITSTGTQEAQGAQTYTVTCEAQPYGKSQVPVSVPLAGSPVLLAAFETSSSSVTATAAAGTVGTLSYPTSPTSYTGSHSLDVPITPQSTLAGDVHRYSMDFTVHVASLSSVLTDNIGSAHVALRQNGTAPSWNWTATLSVTASGVTYTATQAATVIPTAWRVFTFNFDTPIPTGATITDAKIQLVTPSRFDWGNVFTASGPSAVYFDDFEVYPIGTVGVSDGQGITAHLNGVQGSARAPIALALSQVAAGTFRSWCVYSAPANSSLAQPLLPLAGTGTSSAAASYTTAPTVRYCGVYDVWLVAATVASAGSPRIWTVQATPGTATVTATVSPQPNQMVYIGSLVLPAIDYPPDTNMATTFTVASSNLGDTAFNDMLLLDTRGRTIMVDTGADPRHYVWVDAADPTVSLGGIYSGDASDRSDALSVTGSLVRASGLLANPGDTTLLLYSPEGALRGTATYYPRWMQEATS